MSDHILLTIFLVVWAAAFVQLVLTGYSLWRLGRDYELHKEMMERHEEMMEVLYSEGWRNE